MGANPMDIITDRSEQIDTRKDLILAFGRARNENSLEFLAQIAFDKDDEPEIRTSAIHALTYFGKRKIFPLMIDILESRDMPLYAKSEAVAGIYRLRDSRSLFALANFYNALNQTKENERLFGYKIMEAFWDIADPRAVGFLEEKCKSKNQRTEKLAEAALARSKNAGMLYTFAGNETVLDFAKEQEPDNFFVSAKQDFFSEKAKKIFEDDKKSSICFASYVVCPENPEDLRERCSFVLGQRRTEHVFLAQAQDVLAAGQIGVGKDFSVEYADNHSGGYLCAPNSFFWFKKSLESAGIKVSLEQFSALYPANGYFTDDFLSSKPLYNTAL